MSSKAIVLGRENFGEADQYIQFLTQQWGVITTLARSARKSKRRYVGGLDLFCHDEIFLRGDPKERPYLNELTVLNSFPAIREQLDRVVAAGKAVQWVRKLCPVATPLPVIYSVLGQTLSLVEKEGDPDRLELLCLVFKLKLLSQLGLKPRVDACVRCGDEAAEDVVFDVASGGVICRKCAHGDREYTQMPSRLPDDERTFLEAADRFRLTAWGTLSFPRDKSGGLTRLITQFASFHTHTRLPV